METNITVNTSTIKDVLPSIYGTITNKKITILIEAANNIPGQVFSGVITEFDTLYGDDQGAVIKWAEFLGMKVQIGNLSITPNK